MALKDLAEALCFVEYNCQTNLSIHLNMQITKISINVLCNVRVFKQCLVITFVILLSDSNTD